MMINRKTIVICFSILAALNLAAFNSHPKGIPRIWILKFENSAEDGVNDNIGAAAGELLEVFFSHNPEYDVVDREHLNEVLKEQSMELKGLVTTKEQVKLGKLLGATVIISGGYIKSDENLVVNARAYNVETSRIITSKEVKGNDYDLADLIRTLYGRIVRGMNKDLPIIKNGQVDESPISNLHFMRGLSLYYAGKYNHAFGKFLESSKEPDLISISGLWMANCYLAQGQYAHAYIELIRLNKSASEFSNKGELSQKINICREHLSPEEISSLNKIISP